ncbi:hypothetical protein F7Q99_36355 [Streptomyces kaniharaensis]|uniref:DNA primase/polymerase bifunctional N-terminal domain-containing protein n=1 Tax=Streptomyces kaniharaensis TaxID=212423 RepID=A0A6N7L2T9_9ACTN|nr:hypothetical protein [Streptomyces kaniharaensis]MQS17515.1 hypothetical protein [Streptomyces kaniharaensis]
MPTHPRNPSSELAAAMPPSLWLAGALGRFLRDVTVVRWAGEPELLVAMPIGVRFGAVELDAGTGLELLDVLLAGHAPYRVGPVLSDTRTERTYWLTPPEDDGGWTEPHPQARLLPAGTRIAMPDPTPGTDNRHWPVRWAHWPAVNGTLSAHPWLRSLLYDAPGPGGRRSHRPQQCSPSRPDH